MKNDKILFFVQLPPPMHGAALGNKSIVESVLIRNCFNIKTIKIQYAQAIEDIDKISIKKIILFFKYFFQFLKALCVFKPNVVFIPLSPLSFAFIRDSFFVLILRIFNIKYVLFMHGKGISITKGKSIIHHCLVRSVFKKAYVVSLSQTLLKDLEGIIYKKNFIVNYGINQIVDYVLTPKSSNGPIKILYLGNYIKSKGVLDLIDALAKLKEKKISFNAVLIGNPGDLSLISIKEYTIKKLGDCETIEVLGPKYGDEKIEYFVKSDIFVFPTYYPNEALPNVLIEAMQFGLPIISTYEGGIPDLIEDGETGFLVPQRDIDFLSTRIEELICNSNLRIAMGKAAREKYLSNYTLGEFEKKMKNVFLNVIED